MIDISDATKTAYLKDSTPKQLTISFPNANVTLTNADLVLESMELIESIEENDTLQFQGGIASQLKFQVAHVIHDLRGEYVEATSQITGYDPVPLFKGYVFSQTNRTQEDVVTELVCYDVLKTIRDTDVKSWYNGLTFPITVKNFRDGLFSQLGITQETVTLVNDTQTFNKESVDTLYAGKLLKDICQVNGRPGQIGRDGKFYYRKLDVITEGLYPSTTTYPGPDTYPSDENAGIIIMPTYYKSIKYEPFRVEKIDKVTIVNANSTTTSYGSGTNALVLQDNIIARNFTNKSTAMQNLYSVVENRPFIPVDIECKGYPYMECGDVLLSYTKKNVVRSYILKRTLKGIQALFDKFESKSQQYRDPYVESAAQKATANYTQGVTNASNISGVSARVGSLEADHVSVSQLNAVSASINNLSAIAITTQNLSSQSINATQITTGILSADRISADLLSGTKFQAKTAYFNSVVCGGTTIGLAGRSYSYKKKTIHDGDTIYYMGTDSQS